MSERLYHEFGPLYGPGSEILILGSFPSVKSREQQFYYGHPQNRFWKIIAALFDSEVPQTIDEKKDLILDNGLALWDVIESCEITGSSDSSIKNAITNDLSIILSSSPIKLIALNGTAAYNLYQRYDIKAIDTISASGQPYRSAGPYRNAGSDVSPIHAVRLPSSVPTVRFPYLVPAVRLPSSSPANAAWSLSRLISEWSDLLTIPQ